MILEGTNKSIRTKYISGIVGRIEIEDILKNKNNAKNLKNVLLISIINPNNKYQIIIEILNKIEDFINSDSENVLIPFYQGNGKYINKKFDKKNIAELLEYKKELEDFIRKIRKSNNLEDRNSIPLDKNLLNLCHDSLTVSFWDIDFEEEIGNYKPISNEEARKIAKFIKKYASDVKNQKKKFLIHCSAGISRSAGTAIAIHCILDYNSNKDKFSKNNCKIISHSRYMPNKQVFEKIIKQYKILS